MKKTNQVYNIISVDRNGKAEFGFTELTDIEIKEKLSLGKYIEKNEQEKAELKKELNNLKKAFATIIGHIGGVR